MSKETHGKHTEPDILKFKKDEVQKVASKEEDDNGKVGKLMLVGSDGVYFMNNHPMCSEQAFAEGCNPNVDEFDDWWALKRATWGGDDGAEELDPRSILNILVQCKTHLIVAFKEEDGKDVFEITHD